MKKYIFISLLLCLPLLFSCSDMIPAGERYEELPQVEAKRRILIEDFTGQFCSNCPEAHKVIHDLQQQYADGVIAVAIHAGNFGIAEGSNAKITGLMQPEGDTYAAHWGVSAYPSGLINRASGLLKHTDWATYVRDALVQDAVMDIALNCKVSDDSTMLTIDTEINSSVDVNAKLQLWVTESGITAVQQNGGTLDTDYKHNHVYRASVNGLWGEDIRLNGYIPYGSAHQIAVRENWNVENLSVVAFVYNEIDGVLQAAEYHLSDKMFNDGSTDEGSDDNGSVEVKELTFLCGADTIANGSTYISSKLDEAYLALGLTRFVPGINLVGDKDGAITITVQSLNETMVEICAFGGCQMTLPFLDYTTSVSGEITAGSILPLEIHYTPSGSGPHRAEALVTVSYDGEEDKAASFTLVMTNAEIE